MSQTLKKKKFPERQKTKVSRGTVARFETLHHPLPTGVRCLCFIQHMASWTRPQTQIDTNTDAQIEKQKKVRSPLLL